jgi:S1-C subfamily serine protease
MMGQISVNKRTVIIIVLFLSSCSTINTPFDLDHETPVPVRESYISLRKSNLFAFMLGSAVIVENGLAVTNRHVLEHGPEMKGYMAGGIEFPIENFTLSKRLDVAVFEMPCGVGKPVQFGEKIQTGDQIYSAGTTLGSAIMEGVVVATEFALYHADVELPHAEKGSFKGRSVTEGFLYEGDFTKGYSGGPVVSHDGKLVGINQGRLLKFVSETGELMSDPDKTYGVAYHIDDVLSEIKRIAPEKMERCRELK